MWQSFTAKNFRCFSGIALNPLARVNLIAGRNNTGKTALLEAMHIHSYPQDCQLLLGIHAARNLRTEVRFSQDISSWLFIDQQASNGFELISQDTQGKTRSLRVHLIDGTTLHARFPEAEKVIQDSFRSRNLSSPHIILKTEEQGKTSFAIGVLEGNGLTSVSNSTPWEHASIFLGSQGSDHVVDVRAFSDLEAAKLQDRLVASLRVLEPRLKRLSLVLLAGVPMIHGDIGLSKLVPLHFMGEGLRRLASILMAIHSAAGGRVLIDEMENGLHYSVLRDVWNAIALAARELDVQVFATTHSFECIQAAHEAFAQVEPYELCLHRLARVNDQVRVGTYDKETIGTAVDKFLEVR